MQTKVTASRAHAHRRRRLPLRHPATSSAAGTPVFVVYADVPAARTALTRLTNMVRTTHPGQVVEPMLWRFDQLDVPAWREMSLHDAVRAAAIVVALGEEMSLHPAAEAWLTALAARRQGVAIDVLVFVNDETWWVSLERTTATGRMAAAPRAPAKKNPATLVALPEKNVAARAA